MTIEQKFFLIPLTLLTILISGCGSNAVSVAPTPTVAFTPTATLTPILVPTASPSPKPTATLPPTPTATPVVAYPTTQPSPTPTLTEGVFEVLRTKVQARGTNRLGSSCDITNVVIISIDGLRSDALAQAQTPVLDTIRTQGAFQAAARAVVPSVTLINHASMLGGMGPDKHGIYWNTDNTELGKINGPTLFSEAHAAGLKTAMVVGKPKFEDLVLPDSVDDYIYAGYLDQQVINEALALLEVGQPDILFIHLPDVDSTGHALGWMSLVQLLTINRTDGLIGQVVAALEAKDAFRHTLLIVTSDHGGQGKAHGSDSPEDTTIPWLAMGPGVPIEVDLDSDIVTYDTAATVLYALHVPIPEVWDGQPILEIFDQNDCQP